MAIGGVISTSNHPKFLWPGVIAIWGRDYTDYPKEWVEMFDEESSEKAYEEEVKITSFGLAEVKAQGASITYDSESQGQVTRYTAVTYALGYAVTMEELMDDLYEKVTGTRTPALARSHRITEEIIAADVYNNAFDSNFAGSDGVCLLSASHPNVTGGTFSNLLASASDLNETALEDLVTQMSLATDDRGLIIALKPQKLIVHPSNWWNANRILESVFQNDNANNAVNVLKATNAIPGGIMQCHYLDAPNSWFVRSDAPRGLRRFTRMKPVVEKDNDFGTKNALTSAVQRFSVGWSDPLGLFGSEGP
jgi:hypothetical protein